MRRIWASPIALWITIWLPARAIQKLWKKSAGCTAPPSISASLSRCMLTLRSSIKPGCARCSGCKRIVFYMRGAEQSLTGLSQRNAQPTTPSIESRNSGIFPAVLNTSISFSAACTSVSCLTYHSPPVVVSFLRQGAFVNVRFSRFCTFSCGRSGVL